MNSNLINAFSSPVYYAVDRRENIPTLNDQLSLTIRDLAQHNESDDAFRSHQGGYYSGGNFFKLPVNGAKAVAELIMEHVENYMDQLGIKQRHDIQNIRFNSWVALTRKGDYQAPHLHRLATISGVYYVKVPKCPSPQGCLDFISPVSEQEMSFFRDISYSHIQISPEAGSIVIFPAYLRHYTHPFFIDDERICVAFNAQVSYNKRKK